MSPLSSFEAKTVPFTLITVGSNKGMINSAYILQTSSLTDSKLQSQLRNPRGELMDNPMEISYATSSNLDLTDCDIGTSFRQAKAMALERRAMQPNQVPSSAFSQWRLRIRRMSVVEWMEMMLPCSRWIRTYQWSEYLQVDIIAGITVGVMLVPQVWKQGTKAIH